MASVADDEPITESWLDATGFACDADDGWWRLSDNDGNVLLTLERTGECWTAIIGDTGGRAPVWPHDLLCRRHLDRLIAAVTD